MTDIVNDYNYNHQLLYFALRINNLDLFRAAMRNKPIPIYDQQGWAYGCVGGLLGAAITYKAHLSIVNEIILAIKETISDYVNQLGNFGQLQDDPATFIDTMMIKELWYNSWGCQAMRGNDHYWLVISYESKGYFREAILEYRTQYITEISKALKTTIGGDITKIRVEDNCNRAITYRMTGWTERLKAKLVSYIINPADQDGNTLIDRAINSSNIELLQLLLSHHDLGVPKCYNGYSPLCKAIELGNRDIVQMILNKTTDINDTDLHPRPPIIEAIINGDSEIFQMIFDKGAIVTQDEDFPLASDCLAVAASYNRLSIANFLISKKVDVNQRTSSCIDAGAPDEISEHNDLTPLHYAAAEYYLNMIDLLLNHNANVEALDSEGCTPLDAALLKEGTSFLREQLTTAKKLMFKGNANPFKAMASTEERHWINDFIAPTLVIHARMYKKLLDVTDKIFPGRVEVQREFISLMQEDIEFHELINFIVKHKGNIHLNEKNQPTLLMMAAFMEDTKAIETLIEKDVDKNATDGYSTVLHQACRFSSSDIVTLLLEQGCDVDTPDSQGYYPEKWALMSKRGNDNFKTILQFKKHDHYLVRLDRVQLATNKPLEDSTVELKMQADTEEEEQKARKEFYACQYEEDYCTEFEDFTDRIWIMKALLQERLLQAVGKDDIQEVRALLQAGANPNTLEEPEDFTEYWTSRPARSDRMMELQQLGLVQDMGGEHEFDQITAPVDPSELVDESALEVAYKNNYGLIIRELIAQGAQSNNEEATLEEDFVNKGFVLEGRVYEKLFEVIDQILPPYEHVKSEFIRLFRQGSGFDELTHFIVSHKDQGGINLNPINSPSLLVMAIMLQNPQAITTLIKEGCIDKDAMIGESTILHFASKWSTPEILTTLLEQGCSLDNTDNYGYYPEMWALYGRRSDNFKTMLQFKRDDHYVVSLNRRQLATGKSLASAFDEKAAADAKKGIYQCICVHGIFGLEDSCIYESTLLMSCDYMYKIKEFRMEQEERLIQAIEINDVKEVNALIKAGVDVNLRMINARHYDGDAVSPLYVAEDKGYLEVATALSDAGANKMRRKIALPRPRNYYLEDNGDILEPIWVDKICRELICRAEEVAIREEKPLYPLYISHKKQAGVDVNASGLDPFYYDDVPPLFATEDKSCLEVAIREEKTLYPPYKKPRLC